MAFVAVAAADARREVSAQGGYGTAVNNKVRLAVGAAAYAGGEIRALGNDRAAVDDDPSGRTDVRPVALVAAYSRALAAGGGGEKAARALGGDGQARVFVNVDPRRFRRDDRVAAGERHVNAPFKNGDSRWHVSDG